jgi:hypothetical protein
MTRPRASILELARSGALLSTPLEQIAGLRFVAHCGDPDCPAPRPIPVSEVLAAHHGARVGDVATSFRCTACSRQTASVALREDHGPGTWVLQSVITRGLPAVRDS